MILLFCPQCRSVHSLHHERLTVCNCGTHSGQLREGKAWLTAGARAVAIANDSLLRALASDTFTDIGHHVVALVLTANSELLGPNAVDESIPPSGDGISAGPGDIPAGLPGAAEPSESVGATASASSISAADIAAEHAAGIERSAPASAAARAFIANSLAAPPSDS